MTKTANEIIDAIKTAENIMVCGHIRPDGDCISSALAMRALCEKLGKRAAAVCDVEKKPEGYEFLPDYDKFCVCGKSYYDLFIAVDCATDKRLGAYKANLDGAECVIDIDHHPTNVGYGDINYIDDSAASTCSIILDLFGDSGHIDKKIATMLYTGLSTYTGHFMHSNTNAKVFSSAATLCGYGLDVGKLNHDIYCNKKLRKIKLTAVALDGIRMFGGGRIALITLTLDALEKCGCTSEDTEGLIDYASSIGGVEIAVSMCEQPGGIFRVSYRSTGADVSAAAATFGGGGHKVAAGCIVNGTAEEVADKIVAAAQNALES